jgi:hypothetical protein
VFWRAACVSDDDNRIDNRIMDLRVTPLSGAIRAPALG